MSNPNRPGRPVDPNSKASQAHAIYARFAGQDVKSATIRDAIMNELQVTKGTAQVYLHYAKKSLGLSTVRGPRAKSVETPVAAPVAQTDSVTDNVTTSEPEVEEIAQAA